MLTVEDYRRIRRAHRDGMSIREIARTFHHSRRKIREVLQRAEPRPYTLPQPRPRRVLIEEHQERIDEILREDGSAPRKQRHTAAQIYRRLRSELAYAGSYDQAGVGFLAGSTQATCSNKRLPAAKTCAVVDTQPRTTGESPFS